MKRSISRGRFRKYLRLTRDVSERNLLQKAYPDAGKRVRRYVEPSDKAQQKRLEALLKKLKKASSKIIWLRLIIVTCIIAALTVFNMFFLDSILQKRIESSMEYLIRTDVGVKTFDLQIFRGRLSIDQLSIAALDNPDIDRVRVDDISIDFDVPALIRRHAVIQALTGYLFTNVPRDTPAQYPVYNDGLDEPARAKKTASTLTFNTDWIPRPEIPDNALRFAEKLKQDAEEEYRQWSAKVENQIQSIKELARRTEKLINDATGSTLAVAEWLLRIDEANRLIGDIEAGIATTENLVQEAERTAKRTGSDLQSLRSALEKDLAEIEAALQLDSAFLNDFLQAALNEYTNPFVVKLFGYYQRYSERIFKLMARRKAEKPSSQRASWKRLKQGRIVSFPVKLPPRFMVNIIHLGGSGVAIKGSNVGIDHHLVGTPSLMSLNLDQQSGFPAFLETSIRFDDRDDAARVLQIDYDLKDIRAAIGELSTDIAFSGMLDSADIVESFGAQGKALVRSWDGLLQAGTMSLDMAGAPALGFSYQGEFSESSSQIKMLPSGESIGAWTQFLGEALLPEGINAAKQTLEEAIGNDFETLENLASNLQDEAQTLLTQVTDLESLKGQLLSNIDEWKEKYIPEEIPSKVIDNVIEGIKSLF